MGPDCFPVAWNEVNEKEGNLEGEGEVEGGDKDLIATWSEEKNGGQIGHVLGWKFMGKFAHGLGSANTFQVVEVEAPSELTKLLFLLLLLFYWDRLVRCRSLSKAVSRR